MLREDLPRLLDEMRALYSDVDFVLAEQLEKSLR